MSHVLELNESEFESQVRQDSGLVLVDFYAPWCGPCRMLAPFLEKLAQEFAGRVRFVKINVDEAPSLAASYEITGVPTLILFKGGLIIDQVVGLPSPRALQERLRELAPPAPAGVTGA